MKLRPGERVEVGEAVMTFLEHEGESLYVRRAFRGGVQEVTVRESVGWRREQADDRMVRALPDVALTVARTPPGQS